MNHPRIDASLELPRPATRVDPVEPPSEGLVRVSRADDRPLVLAGVRALVRATAIGGIDGVWGDGHAVTGAIHLTAPPAANALVTPRTLVRERIGAGGAIHESVVVPERLPGVVVQWRGSAPADGLDLEVELPFPPSGTGRVVIEGDLLRWTADLDTPAGGVLQVVGRTLGDWRLATHQGASRARIRVSPRPEAPTSLLVCRVDDNRRLPSLPSLAAVAAHRRRDRLEPDEAPGIRLLTGMDTLDQGVAWARAALRARVSGDGDQARIRSDDASAVLRGALAGGESAVARAALASVPIDPEGAEARALHVAWTARPESLLDVRPELQRILVDAPELLRRRVADAAEAAGAADWAGELRTPSVRETDEGRRLPTLGGGDGPEPAPLLEAGDGRPTPAELRRALARTRSPEPDWGVATLLRALGAFHTDGVDIEGPEAALALDLLVRGLLGIEPDAAYGRVTVSPCFPAAWTSFRIDGLLVGDARLDVEMAREESRYRFSLRQTAGGAPVTWIFAPRLPGAALRSALVDGEAADLDHDLVGDRVQPRLQLPAERERVVDLEISLP